jgi:hypothetical protein
MSQPSMLTRRALFGLAAGGALSGHLPITDDPAMAGGDGSYPMLDVAAPRDSALGAWARVLQPRLSGGLAPRVPGLVARRHLALRYAGGVDGVTAANQFDARVVPDGSEALMFCGSLALAWLAGDGMRLDPGNLLPVWAAFGPGTLMVRGILPGAGGRRPRHGTMAASPLRIAAGTRPDAALVALLGLDLLGVPALAVRMPGDTMSQARAGVVDAVFVHGADARSQSADLRALGFRPRFSIAADDAPGQDGLGAPYFLTTLPGSRAQRDPLVAAWRAMAAACALSAAIAVPVLTPADATRRWRRAAVRSLDDPAVSARAGMQSLRLVAGGDAAAALVAMRPGPPIQVALRRWVAER